MSVAAINPEPDDTEHLIRHLSTLNTLDYERLRVDTAKQIGIRASVLDNMVKTQQGGNKPLVEEDCPSETLPSPAILADEIREIVKSHLMLPAGGVDAVTLWIMGTYVFNEFGIFPKLFFTSPEKRCGKTTALEVVDGLAAKAITASNISPSAIFRTIEACAPTLIIDEADTFLAGRNDDLIGIINSGHRKSAAYVIRCEGDNHDPRRYSTWAPMAIAAIRKVSGTVMDRSIIIHLRRKTVQERVERLSFDFKSQCKAIREQLVRWSQGVVLPEVESPEIPNDRAMDNWRPLFSIAGSIGGEWPARVSQAFQCLSVDDDSATPSVMLLEDIRAVTDGWVTIPSATLVNKLVDLEERPWCEWRKGRPMSQNSLAKLLGGFGIHSQSIRTTGGVCRGYKISAFDDAFRRYLS